MKPDFMVTPSDIRLKVNNDKGVESTGEWDLPGNTGVSGYTEILVDVHNIGSLGETVHLKLTIVVPGTEFATSGATQPARLLYDFQ